MGRGSDGPGIGESITLTLSKPMRVSKIGIIPGYAKSKRLYFANNRVAEMKIIIDGKHTVVGKLDDEYIYFGGDSPKGYQWMDLGQYSENVETIQLVINKVYSGRVDDTCIGEIVLRKEMDEEPKNRRAR